MRLLLENLPCLVVGVIGEFYLQKNGQMNLMVKDFFWTIGVMNRSLNGQKINEKMASYEKKGRVKILLFDFFPIANCIFSLLHA